MICLCLSWVNLHLLTKKLDEHWFGTLNKLNFDDRDIARVILPVLRSIPPLLALFWV